MQRRHLLQALAAPALGLHRPGRTADGRPIRLLLPSTPGAVPDALNRELGRRLAGVLGQTVVVENRPGGGGGLMAQELRRAPADGLTLGGTFMSFFSVTPSLVRAANFHPVEDFSHVGTWCHGFFLLATHPDSGLRTVADVLAAARREPGRLNFGTAGVGTPGHLFVTQLSHDADARFNHVPYTGSAAVVLAGLRGEVPFITDGTQFVLPHVAAGKLRALAVMAPQRLPTLPDVPTMAEAGMAGLDHKVWHGLVAPHGLPEPELSRLSQALRQVCEQPDFRQWNAEGGRFTEWTTPGQMRDNVAREFAFWAREIQRAGISTG